MERSCRHTITHTHTHTLTHTLTHSHTHIHTNSHTHTRTHTLTHILTHKLSRTHAHTLTHTHTHSHSHSHTHHSVPCIFPFYRFPKKRAQTVTERSMQYSKCIGFSSIDKEKWKILLFTVVQGNSEKCSVSN